MDEKEQIRKLKRMMDEDRPPLSEFEIRKVEREANMKGGNKIWIIKR